VVLVNRVVVDGLAFPEGPRWRNGRLFFSDMGRATVFAVDGECEEVVRIEQRPSGIGWLPDGTMLVVSMGDRSVLRVADGALSLHADLSALVQADCNDMVVDGRGNAYVGNAGFDLRERPPKVRAAEVVLVTPDGGARVVDDEVVFPNGSVVMPDNATLIVAESFGNRLTAFDIGADGSLSNRRVWAALDGRAPDGICLDAEGAVWAADANRNECVRVAEGGEILQVVDTGERRCFACMLGGPERRTLFLCVAESFSGDAMRRRTGAIEAVEVDVPGAGWP
jgi:sugar lactone lactonase YvrE